jgi:hypothetical protein
MKISAQFLAILPITGILLIADGSAVGSSYDAAWTFNHAGIASYVLQSVEPDYVNLGPIGAEDPNLTLHLGRRYQVTVIDFSAHPFQVIAKGATDANDTFLLSMGAAAGPFESDPNVAWDDTGSGTVTFTLTLDLCDAMKTLNRAPGYRCGIHVSNMRGNFHICPTKIPGDANSDCRIDFIDVAILASHWLECNLDQQDACF